MKTGITTATVEIFHDVECGALDSGPIREGLEIVEAIAGRLQVVREDRRLRISKSGAAEVSVDKVRWGTLEADINVVMTERPLFGDESGQEDEEVKRISVGAAMRRSKVAVVDMKRATACSLTTAHELGHLFGLKREGTWQGGTHSDGHCRRQECIMHDEAQFDRKRVEVATGGLRKLLKTVGLYEPHYKIVETRTNSEFCAECTDQLAQQGQRMALAKLGIKLPSLPLSQS